MSLKVLRVVQNMVEWCVVLVAIFPFFFCKFDLLVELSDGQPKLKYSAISGEFKEKKNSQPFFVVR